MVGLHRSPLPEKKNKIGKRLRNPFSVYEQVSSSLWTLTKGSDDKRHVEVPTVTWRDLVGIFTPKKFTLFIEHAKGLLFRNFYSLSLSDTSSSLWISKSDDYIFRLT